MPKRTADKKAWSANGKRYASHKSAKRAERRARQNPAGLAAKKKRNARRNKRKRR